MLKFNKIFLFLFLCLVGLGSCSTLESAFDDERQFTNKTASTLFVSELFGSISKTISVAHDESSEIAWMGFVQEGDFTYYKITRVESDGILLAQDGQSICYGKIVPEEGAVILDDGTEVPADDECYQNTYSATSTALFEDIAVGSSSSSSTGFVDGNLTVAGSGDLRITIQYSPLQAIESEDDPHAATLVIQYAKPQVGSLAVSLEGRTRGMKSEKCLQPIETMQEVHEYRVASGALDFYMCSKEVARTDQANTPTDSSDPDYRGASTNLTPIELANDSFTIFQVDPQTACILSEPDPTLNPFVLPIPDGLAPIDSMDISLVEGSFSECPVDADGNIYCPANIMISTGNLVSVSGFTATNQTFTAEELATSDCPDFGEISGSGVLGDSELNLVIYGKTLSDQNTEAYNIVDALLVVEVGLEK